MTTHGISCSAKRLIWYKKSIITAIIALLLISSAVTLTLSPFQKSSAQKTALPNRLLPGQEEQQQQQTTTSDAASNKAQEAFNQNNRLSELTDNTNQGQDQQQSNQGQGEEHRQQGKAKGKNKHNIEEDFVPIATSGNNNVYVAWPSNKTTQDFEIMFRTSTDNGKTFGPKINLSNSTGIDSERPQIAALGSNVYVSWWERANQTSNEPVMRISNDNGKTFSEKIMLSAK
jgi:seryl-tRNA synthetase